MKYLFVIFLMSPYLGCVVAQDQSPYITKSFSGTVNKVISETSGGNISVTSVNAGQARVEVYVRPNNGIFGKLSADEIRQRLDDQYTLTLEQSGNTLTAKARPRNRIMNWRRSLSISFRIFVPANVSTDLKTSGGNIELSGLKGDQHFSTSGGNLGIAHIRGQIRGSTSGGNIDINDADNDIDLRTSGGNIHAEQCSGSIRLETSGGSIVLNGLQGNIKAGTSGGNIRGDKISNALEAHTSGGNVVLTGISATLTASTSGGNINISMTGIGEYVRLRNSGGSIDLTLPAGKGLDLDIRGDRVKADPLSNFTGKLEKNSINGKVNGGGIPVTINAGGGSVHLSLR